jgi:hypothetical protein
MQKYGIAPDNVVGHGEIQGDRQSGEGQALVAAVRSGRGTQTAQAATGTMTDATSQTRSAAESVLPGVGVVDRMIAQRDARLATQANRETADYSQFIRDGNERDPAKEAEFVQRYGPNVGKLAQESFDKDAAYGAKVKSIATATPEELDTIIKDYEERKKSPEDYRINKAELDAIGKIIQDRNATLVKDPATYAARYSPEVRQSAQTMATAARAAPAQLPGLSQDYAAATLAEQARLGVPPELQRIATPEMAAAIGKQFEDNPVNAANLMQGLQAQWGSMWPKVHGEIAKNLPGTAVVIGTMNQPDQAHAAQRLAQLSKIPLKEMEKAYKDEELKGRDGLQQTVLERMRGFRSTLVNNPGAEITFNQFQEAIYKLAMDNMGHGDSVERAASRAYEDVIGKKFTMVGMARIPNEYNSGLIMHGAEQALTQLLPQSDIDLPTATPGGMKPEYFKEQFVRSLQAGKGFWVTSFDQTGLTLMQEPTRKAVTIDGKPFTVSWERLLQLSAGANDTAPLSEHEIIYGLTPQMRSMPAPPPVPEPTASPPPSVPPAQGLTMPGGMP